MKHQIVHFLQKYLFNPPIKLLFWVGLVPHGYALLETVGRKTGKIRHTPVGNGLLGKQFWMWQNTAYTPVTFAISRLIRVCA